MVKKAVFLREYSTNNEPCASNISHLMATFRFIITYKWVTITRKMSFLQLFFLTIIEIK
jgi:hypothetical protein